MHIVYSLEAVAGITGSPPEYTSSTSHTILILISFVFIYVFQLHAKVVVQVVKGNTFPSIQNNVPG